MPVGGIGSRLSSIWTSIVVQGKKNFTSVPCRQWREVQLDVPLVERVDVGRGSMSTRAAA
jgi:hypothetical protein